MKMRAKVKARLLQVRHSLPSLEFTSVALAFLLPRFPLTPTSNEPAFCVYKLTILTITLIGSPSASPRKIALFSRSKHSGAPSTSHFHTPVNYAPQQQCTTILTPSEFLPASSTTVLLKRLLKKAFASVVSMLICALRYVVTTQNACDACTDFSPSTL